MAGGHLVRPPVGERGRLHEPVCRRREKLSFGPTGRRRLLVQSYGRDAFADRGGGGQLSTRLYGIVLPVTVSGWLLQLPVS